MPAIHPVVIVRHESETAPGVEEPLPTELSERIVSLVYTDKARGPDKAQITLANEDLSLNDDPRMAEGNKLIVQWGYQWDMAPARLIEIKKVTGWLQLKIEGVDAGAATSLAHARSQTWESATEYEVAAEIARRLGFRSPDSVVIEEPPGTQRRPITQAGETDMAFLQRLADRVDASFRISAGRFFFRPQPLGEDPAFVFTYRGAGVGDFAGEPNITKGTLGIPGRVTRRGYSPTNREETRGTAGNQDDPTRTTLGAETVARDPGPETAASDGERGCAADSDALYAFFTGREAERTYLDEVLPTTAESDSEAQQRARNRFRRAERKAIEMTWPLVGQPRLTSDTVVRGLGFGEKLSGNYLVKEVSHKVGPGYKTTAKVKRNATSRSSSGARRRGARQRRLVQEARQQAAADAARDEPRSETSEWALLMDMLEAGEGPAATDCACRVNDAPVSDPSLSELESILGNDPDGEPVIRYRRRGAGGSRDR